eukprot:11897291-Alexandrium_andersonii.AAC.1
MNTHLRARLSLQATHADLGLPFATWASLFLRTAKARELCTGHALHGLPLPGGSRGSRRRGWRG